MVQMLYMLCVTGGLAAAVQGGNTNTQTQTAQQRYARQSSRMFRKN